MPRQAYIVGAVFNRDYCRTFQPRSPPAIVGRGLRAPTGFHCWSGFQPRFLRTRPVGEVSNLALTFTHS